MQLKQTKLLPITNELINSARTHKNGFKYGQIRWLRNYTGQKNWRPTLLKMGFISEYHFNQLNALKYKGQSREQHRLRKFQKTNI